MPPSQLISESLPAATGPDTRLTDGALADAQRLAERLQSAVMVIFKALPKENRSAAGLARFTELERTICQRLVASVVGCEVGPRTLTTIPGTKTLRLLAAELGGRGVDAEGLESVAAQFDEYFDRWGKSQRGYARLLEQHLKGPAENEDDASFRSPSPALIPEDPGLRRRLRLFQVARETLGAYAKATIQIVIFAPSRTDPEWLDIGRGRGVVGHRANPGAMPLMISFVREGETALTGTSEFSPLNTDDLDDPRHCGVLREFSTDPLPPIMIKDKGQWRFHLIDHPIGQSHGIDLLYAEQTLRGLKRPGSDDPTRCDEVFANLNLPIEGLICDAYLHRDLAKRCIPGLDIQLPLSASQELRDERWATRVSSGPPLKVLGTGLGKAASNLYPRHAELTEAVFKKFGRDPNDFVGYRCEEVYPEWRLAYRMFFDYSTATSESP